MFFFFWVFSNPFINLPVLSLPPPVICVHKCVCQHGMPWCIYIHVHVPAHKHMLISPMDIHIELIAHVPAFLWDACQSAGLGERSHCGLGWSWYALLDHPNPWFKGFKVSRLCIFFWVHPMVDIRLDECQIRVSFNTWLGGMIGELLKSVYIMSYM